MHRLLFISIYVSTITLSYSQNKAPNDLSEKNFLSINDNEIYYEVSGTGTPVLFIHGGFLSLEIWKEQIGFLNENGFKTIAFDDLGHGKTINGNVQIYGYQIIDELRKKLKIQKLNIVGLSWGSMLALDYALNKPDNIDKLVLISPGRNQWNYFQDSLAQINFDNRQIAKDRKDKKAFVEYFQKNWTDGPNQDSQRVPEKSRKMIEDLLLNTVENHWNQEWSKLSTKVEWSSIESKVLFITGSLDAKDILEITKLYNKEIKNSRWEVIKDAAHTLNVEKPLETNRIILKFLRN